MRVLFGIVLSVGLTLFAVGEGSPPLAAQVCGLATLCIIGFFAGRLTASVGLGRASGSAAVALVAVMFLGRFGGDHLLLEGAVAYGAVLALIGIGIGARAMSEWNARALLSGLRRDALGGVATAAVTALALGLPGITGARAAAALGVAAAVPAVILWSGAGSDDAERPPGEWIMRAIGRAVTLWATVFLVIAVLARWDAGITLGPLGIAGAAMLVGGLVGGVVRAGSRMLGPGSALSGLVIFALWASWWGGPWSALACFLGGVGAGVALAVGDGASAPVTGYVQELASFSIYPAFVLFGLRLATVEVMAFPSPVTPILVYIVLGLLTRFGWQFWLGERKEEHRWRAAALALPQSALAYEFGRLGLDAFGLDASSPEGHAAVRALVLAALVGTLVLALPARWMAKPRGGEERHQETPTAAASAVHGGSVEGLSGVV